MVTKIFNSKRRNYGYLKGTKNFEGIDGEDLIPYMKDFIIDRDEGINVEISPTNKRVHAHIIIQVEHYAKIGIDQEAIKEALEEHLPAHLKPATGGAYVFTKIIPAIIRYTLKGDKVSIADLQEKVKNEPKLNNATEDLGIVEDLEL